MTLTMSAPTNQDGKTNIPAPTFPQISARQYRSRPGALFESTFPPRSPQVRMSSLLKPLESASSKRVRIKSPSNSTGSVKRAPSGRIRLVPLPLKIRSTSPQSFLYTSESKREYLDYLKKEIERKKIERTLEYKKLKTPVEGLVPMMDQSRSDRSRRNMETGELLGHKLPSTDVTSNLIRSQDLNAKRLVYFEELQKQTKDRKNDEEQRRLRERNEANKHYEAWANLWGRPGNGAPRNSTNHKKENLWRNLLGPRIIEK